MKKAIGIIILGLILAGCTTTTGVMWEEIDVGSSKKFIPTSSTEATARGMLLINIDDSKEKLINTMGTPIDRTVDRNKIEILYFKFCRDPYRFTSWGSCSYPVALYNKKIIGFGQEIYEYPSLDQLLNKYLD